MSFWWSHYSACYGAALGIDCRPTIVICSWGQTRDQQGAWSQVGPGNRRKDTVWDSGFLALFPSGCNCCLSHFQTENQPSFLPGTGSGEDQRKHLRGGAVGPAEPRGSDSCNTVATEHYWVACANQIVMESRGSSTLSRVWKSPFRDSMLHEKAREYMPRASCYKGVGRREVQREADSQCTRNLTSLYSPFIIHEGHWVNQPHYSSFVCPDTQGCGHLDERPFCSQEEIISPGSKRLQIPSLKGDGKYQNKNNSPAASPPPSSGTLLIATFCRPDLLMNSHPELTTILISPKRSSNESVKERRSR